MEREVAILTDGKGQALECQLLLRYSTSAPGRIKAVFAAPLKDGLAMWTTDGQIPFPEAPTGAARAALGNEFRIEMN